MNPEPLIYDGLGPEEDDDLWLNRTRLDERVGAILCLFILLVVVAQVWMWVRG